MIFGYIKEVQRAKKKGFFIKVEDISGSREFFIRDALDFQKFDLIILYGSKNNGRVYLDKIVKTDYPTLKQLAGGRYDPEWTVARAKKERYGEEQQKEIEKIKSEKPEEIKTKEPNFDNEESEENHSPEEIFPEENYEEENLDNENT